MMLIDSRDVISEKSRGDSDEASGRMAAALDDIPHVLWEDVRLVSLFYKLEEGSVFIIFLSGFTVECV